MDEDLIEKKLSSEDIFDGTLLHVKRDYVELPNGNKSVREWIKHPGAAAVLPVLPDGRMIFVRQYRYPIQQVTLEIPAGKLDAVDEEPLVCAKRELSEETGLVAGTMIPMGEIWPSPGFMDERLHLFCAKELTQGEVHPDEDEFVEIVRMPFEELCQRIASGEIHDAKTVAAIGKALIMGL